MTFISPEADIQGEFVEQSQANAIPAQPDIEVPDPLILDVAEVAVVQEFAVTGAVDAAWIAVAGITLIAAACAVLLKTSRTKRLSHLATPVRTVLAWIYVSPDALVHQATNICPAANSTAKRAVIDPFSTQPNSCPEPTQGS